MYTAQEARQRACSDEEYKELGRIEALITRASYKKQRYVIVSSFSTLLVRDIVLDYGYTVKVKGDWKGDWKVHIQW